MICTGEGIAEYDGIKMAEIAVPKLLGNSIVNVAEQVGAYSWLGYNNGAISLMHRHKIIKSFKDTIFNSQIEAIHYNQDDNTVWVMSQNSGMKVFDQSNHKLLHTYESDGIRVNYDFAFTGKDEMVVGSDEGLFLYSIKSGGFHEDESLFNEEVVDIVPLEEGFLLVGKSRIWTLDPANNYRITELKHQIPEESNINGGYVDHQQNVWITTYNGLHKCQFHGDEDRLETVLVFDKKNGLQSNFIKSIFQDSEYNIWVGTYGGGLSLLVDDFFTFYFDDAYDENDIRGLSLGDSSIWLIIDGVLVEKDREYNTRATYGAENGLPEDIKQTILLDKSETLWLGFENDGLYYKKKGSKTFLKYNLPSDRLSNSIYSLYETNDAIAVGTANGIFIIDPTGEYEDFHLSTKNGLRHNLIYDLDGDDSNHTWVGSKSNFVSYLTEFDIEELEIPIGGLLLDIISVEKKDTNLWLGTINNGLIHYSNEQFRHYSPDDGLLSKYCADIVQDDSGRVWIGHRNGISRIKLKNQSIDIFDSKYGIVGEINRHGLVIDNQNKLWIATTKGLVKYDPDKEVDHSFPPALELYRLTVDDTEYATFRNIKLGYGDHKLEFRFKGISFKHADELVYKYRLVNFDDEWLTLRSKQPVVTYNKLPPGSYRLEVQTCLGDNNCSEVKTFEWIIIDSPFWTKWWFILICVVSGILLVALIIYLRVRQLKKIQNYLQYNLDIKTKEVVDKNKELERKNKDITDSIRYAKRIQGSLLPEVDILREHFPGSFIFYRPRDIVSGDFYWYEQFDDHLFVVCADCTGHGVPGSLMSMIGSVTIGNILVRTPDITPAELMVRLDDEIRNILKTKSDDPYGKIQDGMDLAVCKIDLKTNKTIISSAKRHFFVKIKDDIQLFKPSRHSIGGRETDKVFDDIHLDLNEGDVLYMFSDGYTDQIGGPRGRKMMIPGLLKLLDSLKNEPMDVQEKAVDDHFYKWLGNEYQLDDVLFMAVKF